MSIAIVDPKYKKRHKKFRLLLQKVSNLKVNAEQSGRSKLKMKKGGSDESKVSLSTISVGGSCNREDLRSASFRGVFVILMIIWGYLYIFEMWKISHLRVFSSLESLNRLTRGSYRHSINFSIKVFFILNLFNLAHNFFWVIWRAKSPTKLRVYEAN